MTKTAAVEYGTKGIRVNAVAPGAIRTDILDYAIKSGSYPVEKIEGMFPMRKMGAPIDIAEAIVFLLQSAYSTGTILSVDGGFSAA
jgi:NAD(P)-dependent dehydrogenase (short-subunit alcohol dehydrogenase family)